MVLAEPGQDLCELQRNDYLQSVVRGAGRAPGAHREGGGGRGGGGRGGTGAGVLTVTAPSLLLHYLLATRLGPFYFHLQTLITVRRVIVGVGGPVGEAGGRCAGLHLLSAGHHVVRFDVGVQVYYQVPNIHLKQIEILSTFLSQPRPLITGWAQPFYRGVQISCVFSAPLITLLQQIEKQAVQSGTIRYPHLCHRQRTVNLEVRSCLAVTGRRWSGLRWTNTQHKRDCSHLGNNIFMTIKG